MTNETMAETKPAALKRGVPKEANNGIFGLEDFLMAHPEEQLVCVVTFGVEDVILKEKRGERYPVVEILHIEPIREDADVAAALGLMKRAADVRRGDSQLDIPDAVEPTLDLETPLAEQPLMAEFNEGTAPVTPIKGSRPAAGAEQ